MDGVALRFREENLASLRTEVKGSVIARSLENDEAISLSGEGWNEFLSLALPNVNLRRRLSLGLR